MSEVVIHRLKKKDLSTLTGECSVCGMVAIRKSGTGFQCAVKKAEAYKSWAKRNPERARANRRQSSEHDLFNHDYVANTATCSKCGPVAMTPWGRGNACANLAAERRGVQETEPQRPCPECWIIDEVRVYPMNGVCPRCADPRRSDLGSALRDAESRADDMDGVPAGYHTVDLETFDPYYIGDDESVVPGWNRRSGAVLGSHVRPWNEV